MNRIGKGKQSVRRTVGSSAGAISTLSQQDLGNEVIVCLRSHTDTDMREEAPVRPESGVEVGEACGHHRVTRAHTDSIEWHPHDGSLGAEEDGGGDGRGSE